MDVDNTKKKVHIMKKLMQSLFDARHRTPVSQLKKLTKADQAKLSRMVRGIEPTPSRSSAMEALVRISPDTARRVIPQIAIGRKTRSDLRLSAIASLSRLGGPKSEKALIESLKMSPSTIHQIKIAIALGKMGTDKSIAPLQQLTRLNSNMHLKRQAKFSLSLIGFRQGILDYKPPQPRRLEKNIPLKSQSRTFSVRSVTGDKLKTALTDIEGEDYNVKWSIEEGLEWQCYRNRFRLLFSDQLIKGNMLQILSRSPSIVGLVAQRMPETQTYATRYLLLAWPKKKNEIQLGVYRSDGDMILAGSLTLNGEKGQFELVSLKGGKGGVVQILGSCLKSKIKIQSLKSQSNILESRRPRPVPYLKESA